MLYHVLHILGTAQRESTGLAKIIAALARKLDQERYSIHALFLGEDGPLASELRNLGVPVCVMNWSLGARDPVGAWRFWRDLRGKEFAIIHQHFGGRTPRWLAQKATRAKLILHLHGRGLESNAPTPVSIRIQGADAVIATSNAVAEQVVGMRPQVVYPSPHIPDDHHGKPVVLRSATGKVIGTACRLVPIKGISYLISAVASLRTEIPDIRLEIAGAGPERAALESAVQLLNLENCVTFLGWQENLAPVLARWDIYVQPSLEEGFGMAALEAMAAGLPVVATAVGGVPELVEDGRTGWLVPPSDTAALTDRLRALLLDPMLQQSMGIAGQARARATFSSERMVAKISEIYDEIIMRQRK